MLWRCAVSCVPESFALFLFYTSNNRLDLPCLLAYAILNHSVFTLWVAVTHLTSEYSWLGPRPATCILHGRGNSDIMNITLCCNDAFNNAADLGLCLQLHHLVLALGCQLALSKRLEMRFQFPLDEASLIGWVYHFVQWAWWYPWDAVFFDLSVYYTSWLGTSNYYSRQLFAILSVSWKQVRSPWLLQWRTHSLLALSICVLLDQTSLNQIFQLGFPDRKICFWVNSLIMFFPSQLEGILLVWGRKDPTFEMFSCWSTFSFWSYIWGVSES